jgi:dTDP-4-amino-4,6-dideoxygalactose transaminase
MPVSNSIGTIAAIPLVDLRASHAEVNEEIRAGLDRALEDAAFIKGEEVEGFEREYASFTGVRHCVGVANGTDALELALRSAGVPGAQGRCLPTSIPIACC